MAIMVLAESGSLAYDDPIARYLPQLAPYEGVTIRHLLTHTGGLPGYYGVIDTESRLVTNADALRLLGQMGQGEFAPGDRYKYSVGFKTHIARYPEERLSIVILSNRADFEPEKYIDPISDIYFERVDP